MTNFLSSAELEQYKNFYQSFKFSISSGMWIDSILVIDIPKRRQQVKIYPWNGKYNAEVTNGGVFVFNTVDSALEHLYRIWGK
ncbi:MAG: hypothetical protein ACR2K1_11665 [Saprospiraceae bacterium]